MDKYPGKDLENLARGKSSSPAEGRGKSRFDMKACWSQDITLPQEVENSSLAKNPSQSLNKGFPSMFLGNFPNPPMGEIPHKRKSFSPAFGRGKSLFDMKASQRQEVTLLQEVENSSLAKNSFPMFNKGFPKIPSFPSPYLGNFPKPPGQDQGGT